MAKGAVGGRAFGFGCLVGIGATVAAFTLRSVVGRVRPVRTTSIRIVQKDLKTSKDENGEFHERLRLRWVNKSGSTVQEIRARVTATGAAGEVLLDRNDTLVYLSEDGTPKGATHNDFDRKEGPNAGADLGPLLNAPAERIDVTVSYAGPLEPEIKHVFDDARSRGMMRE